MNTNVRVIFVCINRTPHWEGEKFIDQVYSREFILSLSRDVALQRLAQGSLCRNWTPKLLSATESPPPFPKKKEEMTVWSCSLVQYGWTKTYPHIAGILRMYPDWPQVGSGVCDVCMVRYLRTYLASIISPVPARTRSFRG